MSNEKMVRIEWWDARLYSGIVYTKEECKNLAMSRFSSLGFLIDQDKKTTIFATEMDEDDDFRDVTVIPTTSIISIQPIVPGTKNKLVEGLVVND